MNKVPKKVALIGLDGAVPALLEKHISEGYLPTIKKLINQGVIAEYCLGQFPTITPPNWTTIGTGAVIGTHGVHDFWTHRRGTPLDPAFCLQAFGNQNSKAEYIWDALDRAGKKCIVLNWPGSWPSKMKNGIMIGGMGLSVSEKRDGLPTWDADYSLCRSQMITTGHYPLAIHAEFIEAEGWKNVPEMGEDPLMMAAKLNFPDARLQPIPTTWHVLVRQTGNKGYDLVTLSPTGDFKDAFYTAKPGEWSPQIITEIRVKDGPSVEVSFRFKVLDLSEDGGDFRLLITSLFATSGWANPPGAAKQIDSDGGTPYFDMKSYGVDWFDFETWTEYMEFYGQWYGDAAYSLLTKNNWDAFFMHHHDWMYHLLIDSMDPDVTRDKEKNKAAWASHLRICQSMDRMVAKILEACDKDTLVILVSDHGEKPEGVTFNPYQALIPAGLATLKNEVVLPSLIQDHLEEWQGVQSLSGKHGDMVLIHGQKPDPKNSKAVALMSCYVYVNLKGRDPDGIVESKDYEKVQQQIIDALYTYVDPETGERPVALALTKKDARMLGMYGEDIADVIYAIKPWFGGTQATHLPTAEWGIGAMKTLLTFTGPGIRQGFRLERNCGLEDVVPTICYLMGLPLPKQTDGAVLYQALEEPDLYVKNRDTSAAGKPNSSRHK